MASTFLRRLVSALPLGALLFSTSVAQAQQLDSAITLFNNIRVFDGSGTLLSEPTNVLVRGHLIERISQTPIAIDRRGRSSTRTL